MEKISLPKFSEEKIGDFHSKFTIEPLYPGYGSTIGNALRRVLLSSITGAAATSFKIDGVTHEFTSIPHAKEDVVELMMNLKNINFRSFSDEPVVLELSKKGPAEVTAKDFKPNSNVEIINQDAHLITLDKAADFYLEVTVEKDRGFRAVNIGTGERSEIGRIGIDAFFSPVERVSMQVSDTRVGQMTNYDKLTLEVIASGAITPAEAMKEAAQVLVDHYQAIILGETAEEPEKSDDVEQVEVEESDESNDGIDGKTKIEDLDLSPRTINALINSGIKTFGGLKRLSPLKIEEIKGLGKKGIEEINAIIK
jgi:DNA-directed RNA polymerase subunit alpha